MGTTYTNAETSLNARETNGETPKYNTAMLGPLNITGANTTSLPLPLNIIQTDGEAQRYNAESL